MHRVDLVVRNIDALEVAEMGEGREARDAVGREEERADGRGNAGEESDFVVVTVECETRRESAFEKLRRKFREA